MVRGIVFLFLLGFAGTMNYQLWRSDIKGRGEGGDSVPVKVVWQKILSAPDNSDLEIVQKGQKLGYCRWIVNIGEEIASGKVSEMEPLDGRVKKLSNYTIDMEGNFLLPGEGGRLRFNVHTLLTPDFNWQDFVLRFIMRPLEWEINARAAEKVLNIVVDDGNKPSKTSLAFADLSDPGKVLGKLGFPVPPMLLGGPLFQGNMISPQALGKSMEWHAQYDWMKIGRVNVRVYRLEARFTESSKAVVLVSKVGEILRVELPYGILMVNEALLNI